MLEEMHDADGGQEAQNVGQETCGKVGAAGLGFAKGDQQPSIEALEKIWKLGA